ncbi:MAG: alpha/beta hydrolase [Myxococcota bacterium]|nr:alpha/beta hydrolase [Myxococcota bacterium]
MIGPLGRSWNSGSSAIEQRLKNTRRPRRIDPGRRLKLPFETLELQTSDGVRLSAWFVPGSEDCARSDGLTAVLHHHYGGEKATLLGWIAFFHRLGIPSISFDARGHAASDPSPRGRGSFVKRSEDVRAACDEAVRRGARRILAFGQSQGAAALVISAASCTDVAGCIVESGPAPDMSTAAWGLSGNMLGRVGRRSLLTRLMLSVRIIPGTEPFSYLVRLWTSLVRLRGTPLLWIHGGRDSVIRRGWSSLWFRSLRPRSRLWHSVFVPEADHVRCLQDGGARVEGEVADFIDRLL